MIVVPVPVHESSTRYTDLRSIFSPKSLYRMLCHLVARRTNTLSTTFVVNFPWLFPIFFHSHGISTLNVVWRSHTLQHSSSSCLPHLFIYMVAANATISSKLLNARSLTHGQIHDVTLRPTCTHVKKFSPPVTTKFFLHEILTYEIFSTRIFSNLRYN